MYLCVRRTMVRLNARGDGIVAHLLSFIKYGVFPLYGTRTTICNIIGYTMCAQKCIT